MPDVNAAVCDQLEITGAFHPTPSPRPALVFQFTHLDGTVMPPIVFVFDETVAVQIDRVVEEQTTHAVVAARRARGLS
jgi:hypothetical protein